MLDSRLRRRCRLVVDDLLAGTQAGTHPPACHPAAFNFLHPSSVRNLERDSCAQRRRTIPWRERSPPCVKTRRLKNIVSYRSYVFPCLATTRGTNQKRTTRDSAWSGLATRLSSYCASINKDASFGIGTLVVIAIGPSGNGLFKNSPRFFAATRSKSRKRSLI